MNHDFHRLMRLLTERRSWMRRPHAIRTQQNDRGGWDVVVLIDGSYANRDAAERVVDLYRSTAKAIR
ncbi:hypothetical protein [Gordonia zhaorongruii]|uniref:hypothetical protein n=1 Tax=Gordonia zhaorongruii TaxID=2597659 RepID=UPI00117EC762|nr:hypothetical protein [Gordonia zhaorongruii]